MRIQLEACQREEEAARLETQRLRGMLEAVQTESSAYAATPSSNMSSSRGRHGIRQTPCDSALKVRWSQDEGDVKRW